MQERLGSTRRLLLIVVALSAPVAFAAGCGSNNKPSSAAGAAAPKDTAPATKLSGTPVKVMSISAITASSGSAIISPEVGEAAAAAEKYLNDNGGIKGRPVKVIVCDDKSTPEGATACGRQAVQEGVVALIGTYSQFGDKLYPLLEKDSIVNLGPVTIAPPDFANHLSFPVLAGPVVLPAMGMLAARQSNCKRPGLVQVQSVASDLVEGGVAGGVAVGGKKMAYSLRLPANASDLSQYGSQAADKGDCVMLFDVPQHALAYIPALRQATNQPLIASNNAITAEVGQKLKSQVEGALIPDYFPPADSPEMKIYKDFTDKYAPNAKTDLSYYTASNVFLSMKIFQAIADKLTTVDSKSFYAAINKASDVDTYGMMPRLDFTKANEWVIPPLKRIFNRNMVYTKIVNGKQQLIDGGFHDFTQDGAKAFTPPK